MSNFKDLSKNILSKILFGFLVLSFILFGISSFLMQGSDNWVAKIDGKNISYQQLEKATNIEKQLLLNRNSGNKEVITYLNSGKFKIDVLGKMINERLIETLSNRYGIYPDRSEILLNITQNTNFHKNGKFSHKFFKDILASNGIAEESYIKMISNDTVNTMVLNSLSLVSPIDQLATTKLANLENQIRYADLITISNRNIGKIKYPSNNDLKEIYSQNTNKFQNPQKRNVQYLSFNKSNLTRGTLISNKKVREFYTANKGKFQLPQKRDFYHILVDEKATAEKFHEKLSQVSNKKEAFIALGKELAGKSKKQLLIKNISADESIPEVAQKVFSLKLGENSEIFESELGFHIVLIDRIKEGKFLRFSKVRKEIKKQLREKLIRETLQKKIDQINESLLSSNSLAISAKKFRLGSVKTLKNFTFEPAKTEFNSTKRARKLDQFTQNVFKVEASKASTLIEGEKKFYAIFVTKIIQPRLKTFAEVKRELRAIYFKDKKSTQLSDLAKKVSQEVNENPKLARKIARKYRLKIQRKSFTRTKKIKFQGKEYETSTAFLQGLFDAKNGKATNYYKTDDGKGFKIAVIKKIVTPKLSLSKLNKQRNSLSESYRKGFVESFNNYIEKEHGLTINKKFIESLQNQSKNEL